MQTINEEIFRAYDIRGTYPTTIKVMVLTYKKSIIKIPVLFLMIIDYLVRH